MPNVPERPVDIVFPHSGRREAIQSWHCVKEPIGCGRFIYAEDFADRDTEYYLEYQISGLCPDCQDEIFKLSPREEF